jgi:PAS domain S-box-containing protein
VILQDNLYAVPVLAAAVVSSWLVVYLWKHRATPGTTGFMLLQLAIAEWGVAVGMEALSADVPSMVFWLKVSYVGIVVVPVAWLAFVLQYTGRAKWLTLHLCVLLGVVPAVTLIFVLASGASNLMFGSFRVLSFGSVFALDFDWGTWFWFFLLYAYALILGAMFLLLRSARLKSVDIRQTALILSAVLVPLAGSLVDVFETYPIDLTSFAFAFTGPAFFLAIFRFNLFKLIPQARAVAVQNIEDGILVLDANGLVVEINRAGEVLTGCATSQAVGKPVNEMFKPWRIDENGLSEITVGVGAESRNLDVHFLPLQTRRGRITGKIGVIRDVTVRKRAEEALRESEARNRLLVDKSPVGIGVSTLGGEVVSENEAMQTITGYSLEELKKINIADTYESAADRSEILECLKSKGNVVNHHVRLIRRNGTHYDALLGISRIRLGDKDLVQTTCLDITERKRMENKLTSLHQHALLLNAAQNIDDIVQCTLDAIEHTLGFAIAEFSMVDKNELHVMGTRGIRNNLMNLRLDGPGVTVKAAKTRRSINVPDTLLEEAYVDGSGHAGRWANGETRSELAVPVSVDGASCAVINVENPTPRAFSDVDQLLLETLSFHVASAFERFRKEEALRASEAKYRELFVNVPQAIYRTGPDGKLLTANPALLRLLGYSFEEELLAVDIERDVYVNPNDRKQWAQRFNAGENVSEVELVLRRKDGRKITVLDRAHAVCDAHGAVTYYEGTLTDITERKRMEKEVLESEARYSAMFENMYDSVVVYDAVDGGKDFIIRGFNRAAEETEKITRKDVMGQSVLKAFPGVKECGIFAVLQKVYRTHKPAYVPPVLYSDSRIKGWRENYVYMLLTGEIVAMCHDVTEQKRMEEALMAAQRFATIGQVAAMVGHDLRNPLQALTNIICVVEELLKTPNGANRDYKALLKSMEDQVEYMNKIVSDLQQYTRQLKAVPTDTNLQQLVLKLLSATSIPPTVETLVEVHPDAEKVKVDPELMRRALGNLVSNAIQAMPEGGKLAVGASKADGVLVISVKDTGKGILPENMNKIFTPLFTTKSKGQGFGLAVCKRIVEAHGGTISLESVPDEGTKVTIKLPTSLPENSIRPVGPMILAEEA